MCSKTSLPDSTHFCLCHTVWPDAVPAPRLPLLRQMKGRWYCVCPNCNFYVGGLDGFENSRAAVAMWQSCCRQGDQHIQTLWMRDYAAQGVKTEAAA